MHLSHAEEDAKVAAVLRTLLSKAGFEVWDATEQVLPGDNWALALGAERFTGRLVPVVVRSVKDIPWILEKLDIIRIEANPERQGRRVVEAVKRIQNAA